MKVMAIVVPRMGSGNAPDCARVVPKRRALKPSHARLVMCHANRRVLRVKTSLPNSLGRSDRLILLC
jgi:hypothetical protein